MARTTARTAKKKAAARKKKAQAADTASKPEAKA